jgi:hypothetical protein
MLFPFPLICIMAYGCDRFLQQKFMFSLFSVPTLYYEEKI